MKKLFLFVFPILAATLFFSLSAHAVVIESGLPGGGPDTTGLQPGMNVSATPAQYVRYLYLFVMGFVGIAGLVTLIIWGTVWTASGVVDKKAAAMEGIKNTLYGIGIALSAYILLYTINPDLTIIKTPTPHTVDINSNSIKKTQTSYQWVHPTLLQGIDCPAILGAGWDTVGDAMCPQPKPTGSGFSYVCCGSTLAAAIQTYNNQQAQCPANGTVVQTTCTSGSTCALVSGIASCYTIQKGWKDTLLQNCNPQSLATIASCNYFCCITN